MTRIRLVLVSCMTFCLSTLWVACDSSSGPYSSVNPSDTSCTGNMAIILVGDGYMQTICGCTLASEASQTVFTETHPLTCHVNAVPAPIFFYYLGTRLRHQIISTGPTEFVSSPLSDPDMVPRIQVHSVTLTQGSSIYPFQDALSGISGQIFTP